jgi:hypothetical protein
MRTNNLLVLGVSIAMGGVAAFVARSLSATALSSPDWRSYWFQAGIRIPRGPPPQQAPAKNTRLMIGTHRRPLRQRPRVEPLG